MSAPIDWTKIRTEYIAKGTPYRELAEKYNVNLKTLARQAKRDGWVQARTESVHTVSTRSQQRAVDLAVGQVDRLYSATEKLMRKAEQLLELEEPLSPRDLKALSATLIDARALLGIKDKDDREEQQLRLKKMREELKQSSEEGRKIEVVFVDAPWDGGAAP